MLSGRIGFVVTVIWMACLPLAGIDAATATPRPPATQPSNSYFPVAKGTTWKYLVTTDRSDKAEHPYVQTVTAGDPISDNGLQLSAIGDEAYLLQDDGVYLYGHFRNRRVQPLADPLHILPAKLRTGETWNLTVKTDSLYSTCLGHQTIKTDGGNFLTECVYTTSPAGSGDSVQRQEYRYFAKDIGLVRETITEKTHLSSGKIVTSQITRDLVAFSPLNAISPAPAKQMETIGTDSLQGSLLDSAGQPLAQASFVLKRLDKPDRTVLQTDIQGHFAANGLDPAGVYALSVAVPSFAPTEAPLHSADGRPIQIALRLSEQSNATAAADKEEDPFTIARKLAAKGEHAAALAKYDEAIKLTPSNGSILAYRALSHLALGHTKQAEEDVEAALHLNDKDATIWESAGQVKVSLKQYGQARALFDKAAQLSPKSAGAMYTDLAASLEGQNDPALAGDIESALKSAGNADPPSPEALFQLGQAYANSGKQEGKTYLQKYLAVTAKLPGDQRDPQKVQLAKQLIRALDALK
jgi:tetratricopeptide (TPR) repeat protein